MGSYQEGTQAKHPRRIASNTLVLFVRILVITIINLYAVRLVLHGLGERDYGVFNAVVGVVMTCSCVFPVLAVSAQRFYSYAMGRNEWGRLRTIFSASINIIVVSLVAILVLLETIGLYFIYAKLQIPDGSMDEAVFIFHCALFVFAFSYVQIPYTAAIFAHEDMDVYAYVSCLDCVLKLVVALFVGNAVFGGLAFYGVGLAFVALCTWLCYVVVCRKYPECRYAWVKEPGIYKELLSFSGWTMYGAFAGIGLIQGNNILLNVFFGPKANAAFGVANNVFNAFTSLANSAVLPFRPRMIKSYSARDFRYLDLLFSANNKIVLYLLSSVAIPAVFEMDTIMEVWLGDVSGDMVVFSQLFIIYTVLLTLNSPITVLMQASGHIRNYHLVVETIMLLCLPATWMLFKMGAGAYMAFISMIGFCVVAHVVRIVCLHHDYVRFSCYSYFVSFLLSGGAVLALAVAVVWGIHASVSPGIWRLLVVLFVSPLLVFGLAYSIGINRAERAFVNALAMKILKRRR